MKIIRAQEKHISDVAILFNAYRQFYDCEADLQLAEKFISERIKNQESIVFIACDQQSDGPSRNNLYGFVQLYPSFCSVDAVKIYILYDLFVCETQRKQGLGEKLMTHAANYAATNQIKRIDLLTAFSNITGQRIYEKLGYKKVNENFHAYSLDIVSSQV